MTTKKGRFVARAQFSAPCTACVKVCGATMPISRSVPVSGWAIISSPVSVGAYESSVAFHKMDRCKSRASRRACPVRASVLAWHPADCTRACVRNSNSGLVCSWLDLLPRLPMNDVINSCAAYVELLPKFTHCDFARCVYLSNDLRFLGGDDAPRRFRLLRFWKCTGRHRTQAVLVGNLFLANSIAPLAHTIRNVF